MFHPFAWLPLLIVFLSNLRLSIQQQAPPYTGDEIVVHIISHSHDDPGWRVSEDQYYVEIVNDILTTVIPNLYGTKNNHRKFSQVEMVYFSTWYNEQNDKIRSMVKQLLSNNQFQFNLGGWCMNDEASPTFTAEIRQMTDGQQFILSNFNETLRGYSLPRSGWHIDPSGSSFVTAGLWSSIGFDAFGINRINYLTLEQRKKDKNLEFIWKGSNSLGQESYIFTHCLDSHYTAPKEISFVGGNKEIPGTGPDQSDSKVNADFSTNAWLWTDNSLPSFPSNLIETAETFIADCRNRLNWYRHNQLLIPYGGDFAFSNAYMPYLQMDKLMNYINNNKTYNATLIYSTFYEYIKAINSLNITWELEDDDFFIYVMKAHYWRSGLFTSRADLKGYIRYNERMIRSTEFLYSFAKNMKLMEDEYAMNVMKNISKLRAAQDVAQHHDAITGTEQDYVVKDYKNMMKNGQIGVSSFMDNIVNKLLLKNNKNDLPLFTFDVNSVAVLKQINGNNMVPLALYNTLIWNVSYLINVRCNRTDLVVYDMNGDLVLSQINPVFITSNEDSDDVIIPSAKYNLFFIANLLPISLTTFFIKQSSNQFNEPVYLGKITNDIGRIGENGFYSLTFNNKTNLLESITNNVLHKTLDITNTFKQYGSMGVLSGWNDNLRQEDPYGMRPAQDNRFLFPKGKFGQQNLKLFQFNPLPKTTKLGFITQPHISTYDLEHRYMIHICDINMDINNFTIQLFNLYDHTEGNFADWIVFGDNYNSYDRQNYFQNKYYGSILISAQKASNSLSYKLDLSSYKLETPIVFTSIRKANCNDKTAFYSSIVTSITNSYANIDIARVDDMSSTSWPTDIYLDYIVFDEDMIKNDDLSTFGTKEIDLNNLKVNGEFNVNISLNGINSDFVVFEPVTIVQVQQISSSNDETIYWSTNAVNNNKDNFTLSMQSFMSDSTKKNVDAKLKVFYWSFERVVMKDDVSDNITNTIIKGPLIDEIHQMFEQNYSQSFRVINNNVLNMDLNYIDNDIFLGYIHDYTSVVSHYTLNDNFNKNDTIYTCQNSLEYINRKYDAYCDERTACNMWPTSSQSYIENINDNLRFSTIMNQAHGVGSYTKREYELLLHRRCACDDYPFQNRCLFPTSNVAENVFVIYDNKNNTSYLNRRLQLIQQYQPLQFYSLFNSNDIQQYKEQFNVSWTAANLHYAIPENINLLDLRYSYLNNSKMVLQFWNMFEINENNKFSVNVTIDIQSIFDKNIINIRNVTEMQLTSILPIDKVNRLKWRYKNKDGQIQILDKDKIIKQKRERDASPTEIIMIPRDIRTFVVN